MAAPNSFAEFLREALRIFRRRAPGRYRELHRRSRGLVLHLRAGSEDLTASTTSRGLRIARGWSRVRPQIRARLDPSALVRLTDGTATLSQLLGSEEIRLWGTGEDLLRGHDALEIFLETAVRSPPLQRLFERYRDWVARSDAAVSTGSAPRRRSPPGGRGPGAR